MTKNRQNLIALNIWCYVSNYFAMFVDPSNRGPNFTWSEFPRMAQDYADTNMWIATGLEGTSKNKKKELEFIRKIAEEIAENLVRLAGLSEKTPILSSNTFSPKHEVGNPPNGYSDNQ